MFDVKVVYKFVCMSVCKVSVVFVCKPRDSHKCPSHVFVSLCNDDVCAVLKFENVFCG